MTIQTTIKATLVAAALLTTFGGGIQATNVANAQRLRSPIALTFENNTEETHKIYWRNNDGDDVLYKVLDPGLEFNVTSFPNAVWFTMAYGHQLKKWTVGYQREQVISIGRKHSPDRDSHRHSLPGSPTVVTIKNDYPATITVTLQSPSGEHNQKQVSPRTTDKISVYPGWRLLNIKRGGMVMKAPQASMGLFIHVFQNGNGIKYTANTRNQHYDDRDFHNDFDNDDHDRDDFDLDNHDFDRDNHDHNDYDFDRDDNNLDNGLARALGLSVQDLGNGRMLVLRAYGEGRHILRNGDIIVGYAGKSDPVVPGRPSSNSLILAQLLVLSVGDFEVTTIDIGRELGRVVLND